MAFAEQFSTFSGCGVYVAICAVITGIIAEVLVTAVCGWVRTRPWWEPQARELQKALLMNFGFKAEACTPEACLDAYAFILVICCHHTLTGGAMVPVVYYGWEAAGPTGQLLFLLGGLSDVGYDVYDEIKMILRCFFHGAVKSLWNESIPIEFFVVLGVLHHPLAMTMLVPMCVYYPSLRALHLIACALLLAAGVCFVTGSYKFTLNTKTRGGFLQYKAIVIIQFVTIMYTRGFIWFTQLYAALTTFYAAGDTKFLIGGCVGGLLMSFFNVIMVADATGAAVKWIPKPMPKEDHEHADLAKDVAKGPSRGSVVGASAMVGLIGPGAKKFHMNVKVVQAAVRFKKGAHKAGEKKEE